ncbi:helix-turn-helix domain-containing protein [Ammoniphilus sp. 3BR4]|uniref:helix-turn-helix domain-containing protein n=1 Tax=Ammoniphilus sp. 3BR4 TaxID=3158265 RepID=UPI00346773CC
MKQQKATENHYFPFQPEIQSTTDFYREAKKIKDHVNKDVALFYQFNTNKHSVDSLSLVPDGCFDILFCCESVFPSAILWTSPSQRRKQPNLLPGCEYFGVRFYPEQSALKLESPMKDLVDQQIPLLDVLKCDSSIIEQIGTSGSFTDRIQLFESFLNQNQQEAGFDQRIIDYAMEKIYLTKGTINIGELSRDIGYTEQYVRRKFEEYIGFSPKQFCQIVKFQNSLHRILTYDGTTLLDAIHESGYYDQPSFIKGFKKFANFTPKQYREYLN